jgi:RHS repeat-associated protein
VVLNQSGTVEQVNHYYPFGGLMGESTAGGVQPYKYNGKELDRMHGLDLFDYGARHYDAALGRWFVMDPMAEKYYSISQYAYVGNNPVNAVDLRGDSLTLVGDKIQETLMAIYNGLEDRISITMNFNNGVLDPSSIAKQAQKTTDVFLQDIYEIAINPTMVELSISNKNTYMMNGREVEEEFTTPYDYNTNKDPQAESLLKIWGEPIGNSIHGNLGQTLIPGNVSASGKSSKNNNVQMIINGKGSLNHRTVGIAHEFGHVVLFLKGLPYGHGQPGVNDFVYDRATIMSKRLGYDF